VSCMCEISRDKGEQVSQGRAQPNLWGKSGFGENPVSPIGFLASLVPDLPHRFGCYAVTDLLLFISTDFLHASHSSP
jgi:hypothetical protein